MKIVIKIIFALVSLLAIALVVGLLIKSPASITDFLHSIGINI
jgi:hypothetical protein